MIAAAADVIASSGLVVFPTRCLYGIGGRAGDERAVKRIFAAKQRLEAKPLSVLIPDRDWLARLVADIPASAERLMDRFWPGQLTLVFEDAGTLPESLTAASGKIGIRLPHHPAATALVRAVGEPITATSANISGAPGVGRIPDLSARIAAAVDCILDAGELGPCPGSTVVDVTQTPVRVLREGVIPKGAVQTALNGSI